MFGIYLDISIFTFYTEFFSKNNVSAKFMRSMKFTYSLIHTPLNNKKSKYYTFLQALYTYDVEILFHLFNKFNTFILIKFYFKYRNFSKFLLFEACFLLRFWFKSSKSKSKIKFNFHCS